MTSRNAYTTSRFSVPASAGPLLPLASRLSLSVSLALQGNGKSDWLVYMIIASPSKLTHYRPWSTNVQRAPQTQSTSHQVAFLATKLQQPLGRILATSNKMLTHPTGRNLTGFSSNRKAEKMRHRLSIANIL